MSLFAVRVLLRQDVSEHVECHRTMPDQCIGDAFGNDLKPLSSRKIDKDSFLIRFARA